MYAWLHSVFAARSPPCSIQAADGHRSARVAHQFFNCAQEMPEGEATFATLEALGRPTQDCWFHRIPQRDLDPAVAAGDTNISILAVVTGGACGESTALGFTAGPAVRDYFVQGSYQACAWLAHPLHAADIGCERHSPISTMR